MPSSYVGSTYLASSQDRGYGKLGVAICLPRLHPLLVWLFIRGGYGCLREKSILQTDLEGKEFFQENKDLGKKSIYSGTSIYYLFIAKGMGKFIRYMEG